MMNREGNESMVVRWERFLPKMVIRVLLVEADDSTRQIITALLRKCSYKVDAVSDGLKAWELLKGKPLSTDLILTEVDVPSISGLTLLTLITEHEVCKNIPVIMMSSHDSVSTVYRCMLRGAADFLVKPIRKNELSNLWQHVWRRQASSGSAQGPVDESVAEETFETTAENNACSSSTGNKASIQRIQECAEKGSDSQGSCTKPELENEGENTQDIPRSKQPNLIISLPNDVDLRKEELCHEATIRLTMSDNDAGGSAPGIDANTRTREEDMASYANGVQVRTTGQTSDDCHAPLTKQAIDLIGAFDNYLKCDYRSSASTSACKVDPSPLLDLSLSRSQPCGSIIQFTDEKHKLNHSDASAFRRYVTSAVESRQSISAKTCDQLKEYETDSDKQFFNRAIGCNSDTRGPMTTSHNHVPYSLGERVQVEIGLPSPQQRLLPLHVPVRGVRFEGLSSAYSSMISPILCTPSGISTLQCPGSAIPQESSCQVDPLLWWNCETRSSRKLNTLTYQNNSDVTTHNEGKKEHKSESATDQSANISCFSGPINHLHIICESNENNSVRLVKTPAQCSNEESSLPHDRNWHRSQREAALTKFLLKRKDRCFEKKVRYESRKKLAEQRPRVKGQFVRQVPSEPPSGNS